MAEQLKPPSKKQQSQQSSERRKQIALIVLMVAGLFTMLAIFSYAKHDEAITGNLSFFDVFRVLFNDHVKAQAEQIENRFGLLGALIADVFVNDTIGYFSLSIPILVIMWAWVILRKKEIRNLVTVTNYALVGGILASSTMGIAGLLFGLSKEWSGLIGAFAAAFLTKLLGSVGASIFALTALCVTTILAIDLDVHKSIERVSSLWRALVERYRQRGELQPATAEGQRDVMINKSEPEPKHEVPAHHEEHVEEDEPEEYEPVGEPVMLKPPLLIQERPQEDVAVETEVPPPVEDEQEEIDYVFPSVELLDTPRHADTIPDEELKANAELVRAKLANFGVEIESVSVTPGPVITQYELVPASGVKISRIVSLADDLALVLAAKGIRIMAPIPGKSAVGVEIPNKNPSIVHLRSVLNSSKFRDAKAYLPIALGKTISGDVLTDDLAKMPHLLIAGSTGSGKSVGINTILASLLFRLHPSDVKFIIIDPKKIEMAQYARLKQHFLAVSPDLDEEIITTPENSVSVLKSVELEMEKRYDRLASAGVRNIQDYNDRQKAGRLKDSETVKHRKMPYVIVIVDELADLMMTAAREVEEPIARLAQLARAVGIHLVLATQRPSVDVITGVIKANFPARIAYQVASKTDSRTILDMNGAEQLLGSGDMLYLPPGSPKPMRIQNAFISTDEVERLTDHIARQQGYKIAFQLPSILDHKRAGMRGTSDARDEFFEEAARIIVRHQQGSVSLLQRRLKVGYSRAARLVDELEAAGIVGPFDGSKARLVLVESDDQLDRILETLQ